MDEQLLMMLAVQSAAVDASELEKLMTLAMLAPP